MREALIGHSGFVGSAILRHHSFDALFRSTDIDGIRGQSFDLVVCCGAPAEKWRANKDPEADRAQISRLVSALESVTTKRFVLISTIDVYPHPAGVDENTTIEPQQSTPYGQHRFQLEEFCRAKFGAAIVRLPGLYGQGLKKNAIFDLLNDRPVDAIPANAFFQFYDVERTWSDVEQILRSGISVVNINSVPVCIGEITEQIFHRTLPMRFSESAPHYDVHSLYASQFGGRSNYWLTAEQVFAGIRAFVEQTR